jgi:hypothetical protein
MIASNSQVQKSHTFLKVLLLLIIPLLGIRLLGLINILPIQGRAGEMLLRIQDGVTIFLGIMIEAVPFLLLGVVVSALMGVYVKEEMLFKSLPKNRFLLLILLSFIGAVFPVCECGNIPVARRLILKGLPVAGAITFLLAAPVINPVVLLSTWAAFSFDIRIVFYRFGFTLLIAVIIGFLFSFNRKSEELLQEETLLLCEHSRAFTSSKGFKEKMNRALHIIYTEFFEMGQILVLGAALAAFTQTLIPREVLLKLGQGPIISIISLMILAFVISICSTVDAFFALSYANTFTNGSLLAFLVFGPMMDIKSTLMMLTTFKVKTVVWIIILSAQLTLLLTLFLNLRVG